MSELKTYLLDDVVEKLIDYRGKTPVKTDSGIPLITAKVIKNGRIETPNEFISEEDYDSWMIRGIPEIGDVVLTTEAPLGEVAQINTKEKIALAQRVITLRGKKNVLDSTYLKYFLFSPIGQGNLKAKETGSTVTGIKQSELRKVEIYAPDFDTQQRIAHILASIDDKIELNLQMNQTLEAMAQAIFKDWFINFKFPEFDGKFVNGLPTGWKAGKLKEICTNIRKSYNPKQELNTNYIGLEHIPRKSITLLDWGHSGEINSQKSHFVNGDILFGKLRPYFHKVIIAPFDGICSTDILVIRALNEYQQCYSYFHLFSDDCIKYANSHSDGTRMPRVNWDSLSNYKIPIPPKNILSDFQKTIYPIIEKINASIYENQTLTQTRDTLLPKLMSGQIVVNR